MTGKSSIFCWLLCLLAVFSTSLSFAEEGRVCILKSSNNAYFSQTIDTLKSLVKPSVDIHIPSIDALDTEAGSSCSGATIITLGYQSAIKADELFTNETIINAYITHAQIHVLNERSSKRIGVLLEQPLGRYLAFADSLLNPDSVGIITNTKLPTEHFQQSILESGSLVLHQYQANTNRNILPVTRSLFKTDDALLMLPEPAIYNRRTLKGILLTSYRSRKPVISYSPGHVKSGALGSVYSSPKDIGRQLADILTHFNTSPPTEKHNAHYSKYFSIVTNPRVAHALNINLPDEETIRQHILAVSP